MDLKKKKNFFAQKLIKILSEYVINKQCWDQLFFFFFFFFFWGGVQEFLFGKCIAEI